MACGSAGGSAGDAVALRVVAMMVEGLVCESKSKNSRVGSGRFSKIYATRIVRRKEGGSPRGSPACFNCINDRPNYLVNRGAYLLQCQAWSKAA